MKNISVSKELQVIWNEKTEKDSRGRDVTVYEARQWDSVNQCHRSVRMVENPTVEGTASHYQVEVQVSYPQFIDKAREMALKELGIDPSEYTKINHQVR